MHWTLVIYYTSSTTRRRGMTDTNGLVRRTMQITALCYFITFYSNQFEIISQCQPRSRKKSHRPGFRFNNKIIRNTMWITGYTRTFTILSIVSLSYGNQSHLCRAIEGRGRDDSPSAGRRWCGVRAGGDSRGRAGSRPAGGAWPPRGSGRHPPPPPYSAGATRRCASSTASHRRAAGRPEDGQGNRGVSNTGGE